LKNFGRGLNFAAEWRSKFPINGRPQCGLRLRQSVNSDIERMLGHLVSIQRLVSAQSSTPVRYTELSPTRFKDLWRD
jgi:hypothetical protein